jgi:uncharacterized protein Yka (UPF0111/DUF47 family)
MGFKEWIIPQEHHFFDLLNKQADVVLKSAEAMVELLRDPDHIVERSLNLHKIENDGDAMVHEIVSLLNKTFVTPIDHDDISKLSSRMDDIIDYIDAAATRIRLYEITQIPPQMIQLMDVLLKQARVVHAGVHMLEKRSERVQLQERCVEVNRLENIADEITHSALAGLFKLDDIKMIMKLKEVYEHLEEATDMCEDVADIVKDVVIKNS